MKHIAQKIKTLRESSGLTQDELGEKIGVEKQSISAYENNKQLPTLERLNKMAEVFNVDMSFFFSNNSDKSQFELLRKIEELEKANAEKQEFIDLLREKLNKK